MSDLNVMNDTAPQLKGRPFEGDNPELELSERITNMINSAEVFLFMKGNPMFPQCGFSANTVGILNHLGVEFKTFDILSDFSIREGVKEFSSWPTYPQLYFKGEMIGGNDIISEMFEEGELQQVLNL